MSCHILSKSFTVGINTPNKLCGELSGINVCDNNGWNDGVDSDKNRNESFLVNEDTDRQQKTYESQNVGIKFKLFLIFVYYWIKLNH